MNYQVKQNLLQIQEEIAPYTPNIIAVTKYFDADAIRQAYEAGLRDFAESKVIESSRKIDGLADEIKLNSKFHFIGHLQTNKVKQAVEVFDYIHSADSVKLIEKISDEAQKIGKTQKILVQINNANEEQKFGFSKGDIFKDFAKILESKNIEVVGVMNIAPLNASENELTKLFEEIVQIRDELEKRFNCKLREISMGMSQDYKIAARMGSTMLRIGNRLFR